MIVNMLHVVKALSTLSSILEYMQIKTSRESLVDNSASLIYIFINHTFIIKYTQTLSSGLLHHRVNPTIAIPVRFINNFYQ